MECLSTFIRSEKVKVCCIYKVTNKLDGKVYIGQTTNFRKRLSDYNNLHKKNSRLNIAKAIKELGQDNFTIEILEECDQSRLDEREAFYINKYKSHHYEYGYNINKANYGTNSEISRRNKSLGHIGLKESADVKRKKSNEILIVRKNRLMICDSAKLFGDLVGHHKDNIKNYLRGPRMFKDMFLYYSDSDKRAEITEKAKAKKERANMKEYLKYAKILDKIEKEGVETIYRYFDECYTTFYTGYDAGYRIKYLSEEDLYYSDWEDLSFPCDDDDEIDFTYDDFNSFYIDPETGLLCIYD